ncbi:MAG: hypothetical protein AABX38_07485 [Candidatus Micrarchaeota archaeon]
MNSSPIIALAWTIDDPVRLELALSKCSQGLEIRGTLGDTLLTASISAGHFKNANFLIDHEISLDTTNDLSIGAIGSLVLYLQNNHTDTNMSDGIELLQKLISKGADVNTTNSVRTPVVLIAQNTPGLEEIAKILLDAGADPNFKPVYKDPYEHLYGQQVVLPEFKV